MVTIKLKNEDAILLSCVISQWIVDGDYRATHSVDDIKFLESLCDTIFSVSVDKIPEYLVYKEMSEELNG